MTGRRDPGGLAAARYDLVVVGGGIHGLFAAYDAASRGLSVALVERDDFGSGLSFNHQRTIHGGLRDLAAGRIAKARRQIGERRAWAHMAPHLIRPLPFLIGTYRLTKRSRWALRAGFAAYDLLGRSGNSSVPSELHLPKPRLESAATTRRLFPGVAEAGLTGGAVWYDYQVKHPDRLNWTVALAAAAAGARLVNYVEAVGPLKEGGRIAGVKVRDRLTGSEYDVLSKATLLSAGSGLGPLMTAFGVSGAPPLLRAMNLLLDRPARDIAVAAPATSGRMLTLVPWRGLLARRHLPVIDSLSLSPAPRRRTPPSMRCWQRSTASFRRSTGTGAVSGLIHHGLTPAVVKGGRAELQSDPAVIDHHRNGAPGLVSVVGVKLTTARHAAELAVDAICRELGGVRKRCRTAAVPLPHAGIADVEGRLTEALRAVGAEMDRDVDRAPDGLVRHRSAGRGRIQRSTQSAQPPHAGQSGSRRRDCICGGTVVGGKAGGRVLRRTPLGSAGHPGRAALERAADVMGGMLGWTPERRSEEIAAVELRYPRSSERAAEDATAR